MAVKIQTKRSTGTSAPGTLAAGELAVTYGGGTQGNNGERLFVGNNDGSSVIVIGGKYFSDKLDHVDGTLTASSALTADSNSSIDKVQIGNAAAAGGILELREGTNNGSNYIQIAAPAAVTTNTTFTLPDGDGNDGQFLKTDGSGQLGFDTVVSSLTLAADSGSSDTINTGETLTFEGGEGIDTTVADNKITIAGEDASDSNKGIASFVSADFSVASGAVSLSTTPSTFAQLNIDNLRLDGNTLSSQDADGNIVLDPNGTGVVDVNTSRIINVTDPSGAQDAATKAYVDATVNGLDVKGSVVAASTGNGVLSGAYRNGDSLDGVTLSTGDRILLKDQTTGSENGIYTVNASGAPTRATDFDSSSDASPGSFVFVEQGTTNGDNGFVLTNNSVTLGSTALTFVQFSGAGQITAGDGLTKNGNTINVEVGNGLDVAADEISVDLKANGGLVIESTEIAVDLGASSITGTLAVGDGGTGATTLTDGGILLGSGTGAITAMAALADGEMIVGDGTTDPVAESGDTLRISIGVGSSSTWQITGLNIGHASDTTLTRASAGDLQIESNIIYRAGGTDVAVADGGTGISAVAKGSVLVANTADTISALDGGGSSDGILLYTHGTDTISWSAAVDGGTF
tara:strand:+ start:14646 stop:16538 length:1893 start_codon:yes stop_codon:yes gene_type:complete